MNKQKYDIINDIANKVRDIITKKYGTQQDLSGHCLQASDKIVQLLKEHKIKSKVISGYILLDDQLGWQYPYEYHYWVQCDGYFIDVTIEQFNNFLPYDIQSFPPICVFNKTPDCLVKRKPRSYNIRIAKQLIKIAKDIIGYRINLKNDQRECIKKYIDNYLQNNKKIDQDLLKQIFYKILTSSSSVDEFYKKYDKELFLTKQRKDKYEQNINKIMPIHGTGWNQFNINQHLCQKKSDKTYNVYFSIQFDSIQDINNYLRLLIQLQKHVIDLSDKQQSCIKFKTHATLVGLLNHNDTLKFYYYENNKDLGNKIESLVKKYISKFSLKQGSRRYTHGVDLPDKKSFGDLIASKLSKSFIYYIQQYKDRYDSDRYIDILQKNLEDMIQKAANKVIDQNK